MIISAPPAPPVTRPLSERLRDLVIAATGEATLTCSFRPGGKKFGEVGIRSHFYCEACGGSALWHEVAEGVRTIKTAEEIIRAHRAAASSTTTNEEGF